MPLDAIAADIGKTLETRSFTGSLKFDCGEAGVIVLADGTASTTNRDTDCTLRISEENLVKLLTGKLNPMTGVMMGKLKVSGDLSVAMGLAKLLG
ncbi:SCP2 sterol-binding domain-containing protein [Defluviimonas aestuarii]|uniref:SCP2 sterol-binding domain-containing protein n=1 Tax=Albidovulum aestuarii TaxID=1130726 RepID=UPI00249B7D10|nr:SCP2 sterol-binding domain-containing protein [Defluviimonas aestuarii]MDI3337787.1 SCP2 sterol-binding domain-containing protein [Defluviimonas aestuarii]